MTFSRHIQAWGLPLGALLLAVLLQTGGDPVVAGLRYDRAAIHGGELWRLLSGHFVHLGAMHLLLNAAGLLLVWALVGGVFSSGHWLVVIACALLALDLGFWWLLPELDWYVGLSGLLHGLLAAGATGLWRERRTEALMITGLLVGKLGYEALFGTLPGSAELAGGAVVTAAHLFGAVGGFLAGLLISIRGRPRAAL